MKTYIYYSLVTLVLLLAFVLRLYRIESPLADWHSWRQSDTASVSRELLKHSFDVLHPRFHDLSNVPSGFDNPEGYRFVEFPMYNFLHAFSFQTLPIFSFEVWGRLITIFSSVLSTFFIFGIMKQYFGRKVGLLSAFFYAVLPFNIFFGRVILPDPSMTMSYLGAIYFFILWASGVKSKNASISNYVFLILSFVFAASALLLKPFAGFFLLPLALISYQEFGFSLLRRWELYVYAIFSIIPLLLWRTWMAQYPEGIPVSDWLFNGGDIRFTGAYFYWIFAERIGKLILGYFGIGIFVLGLVTLLQTTGYKSLRTGKSWIIFSFLFSTCIYLVVIARGNVQHDYYQIPIVPSLAMVLGVGAGILLTPPKTFHTWVTRGLLFGLGIGALFFSWYYVRDFFNINNPNIVIAGEAVDRLTPKDAKVVTFYNGDTTFLYQTKRSGWSSLQDPMPVLIEKGADYLVIVNPTEQDIEGVGREYEVVESQNEYLLLKLK